MTTVNIFEAKTNLSRLIEAVETGKESEIIIARNGRPVVRIAPLEPKRRGIRIGLGKGKFKAPENTQALDDEIAELFYRKEEPSGK